MVVKPTKKPVFWVLLGLFIACLLALPGLFSRESVEYYFKQISENGDFNDKASSWLSWSSSSKNDVSAKDCTSPLKVYMYELPRKYNMGLLVDDVKNQEVPWTNHLPPIWGSDFGVNKQHSVEYWLMLYILNSWDRKDKKVAAVRVRNPAKADVFFVPFFSARSFNNFGVNMTHPKAEVDKELQVRPHCFPTRG